MKKNYSSIKLYLLAVNSILTALLIYTVFSTLGGISPFSGNISVSRLLLLILLGSIDIALIFFTYKTFFAIGWLEKFYNLMGGEIPRKQAGTFQFVVDMTLSLSIIPATLVFLRYRYYGFLAYVWEPLPSYLSVLTPYLASLLTIALLTYCLLIFVSYSAEGKSISDGLSGIAKNLAIILIVFLVGVGIYWGSAIYIGKTNTPALAYFPNLAESFINGQLYISNPPSTKDLTFYQGRYYLSFPPLGGLLMVPKVASTSRFGVNTVQFSIGFAAATLVCIFFVLDELRKKTWISLRRKPLTWIVILFGFGTSQWYMVTTGAVWHIAQILATFFFSLALLFSVSLKMDTKWDIFKSAFWAGTALGLSMLSRPHLGFAWFFILGIVAQSTLEKEKLNWRRLFAWASISAIPMSICVAGLGWYNFARFGSVTDFGYTFMLVGPNIIDSLQTYGQFHPRYIWKNIKSNWLGLPYWDNKCNRLAPNREGMSIFLTTPGLLFLYRSLKKEIWVIGGWVSMITITLVHLFYFNTGAHQFGYRFSLDFLVIAFCLLAAGFGKRLPKYFPYLVVYSVIINFIGVLWNAKLWCITW